MAQRKLSDRWTALMGWIRFLRSEVPISGRELANLGEGDGHYVRLYIVTIAAMVATFTCIITFWTTPLIAEIHETVSNSETLIPSLWLILWWNISFLSDLLLAGHLSVDSVLFYSVATLSVWLHEDLVTVLIEQTDSLSSEKTSTDVLLQTIREFRERFRELVTAGKGMNSDNGFRLPVALATEIALVWILGFMAIFTEDPFTRISGIIGAGISAAAVLHTCFALHSVNKCCSILVHRVRDACDIIEANAETGNGDVGENLVAQQVTFLRKEVYSSAKAIRVSSPYFNATLISIVLITVSFCYPSLPYLTQ